jgi:hypothetical protein
MFMFNALFSAVKFFIYPLLIISLLTGCGGGGGGSSSGGSNSSGSTDNTPSLLVGISTIIDNEKTQSTSDEVGLHNSIAVDSSGHAHISYAVGTGTFHFNPVKVLKYASNVSGKWVSTIVDSNGQVGGYTSIAVDSKNNIHISYYDYTNKKLKYATKQSGIWQITSIDSGGQYSSIAIDSADRVHISYYDSSSKELKYVTNVSGSWIVTAIKKFFDYTTSFTSIAVDSTNTILISFMSGGNLNIATNATGQWSISVLDTNIATTSNAGRYTSLALDSADHAHISYMNENNYSLKYATNASGLWVKSVIDVSGGEFTSIALDSHKSVHIVYYDRVSDTIKYATNVSSKWVIIPVEGHRNMASQVAYSSIAADTGNNIHISYYHHSDGNLRYAYYGPPEFNASGMWHFTDSNTWADSGCVPDVADQGTYTITQNGNYVTLTSQDGSLEGGVSGRNYYFAGAYLYNGFGTKVSVGMTLSSSDLASGQVLWVEELNTYCEKGNDFSLYRIN